MSSSPLSLLREWVFDKKVPAGIGFARALGTALALVWGVQAFTGILLTLVYAPTPDHAYDSIQYIDHEVAGGALARGIHHFGASAVVVLAGLHLFRVFCTAGYKRPRQWLWVVGMAILLGVIGFGFTGYLLPWDQKGYWATKVGLNIAGTVPVVGPWIQTFLQGGPEVGAPTLVRMYALHVVVLPMTIFPLIGLHLFLVHKLGITPPGVAVGEPEVKSERFFPDHVARELLVGLVALGVVLGLALHDWHEHGGAPLEARADAAVKGYDPRPDWYFLGLFQLLRLAPFQGDGKVIGTVVLPGLLVGGLFLLPFLDRSRHRRPGRRFLLLPLGFAVVAGLAVLTVQGALLPASHSPREEWVPVAPAAYEPPPQPPITAGDSAAAASEAGPGRALLDEYGCLECHTLDGEGDTIGQGAPEFREVGKARSAEWIREMLIDPSSKYEGSIMMSASQLGLEGEELEALIEFLVALGKEPKIP